MIQGQSFAEAYVRHSSLKGPIVGWGALPEGDGIELFVHQQQLAPAELEELGGLPGRVVVILGVNGGRPL